MIKFNDLEKSNEPFEKLIDDFSEIIDELTNLHEKEKKEIREIMIQNKALLPTKDDYSNIHGTKTYKLAMNLYYNTLESIFSVLEMCERDRNRNMGLSLLCMKWNFILLMKLKGLKNEEIEDMTKDVKEAMKEYEEDAPFIKDLKTITEELKKRMEDQKNYHGVEYE